MLTAALRALIGNELAAALLVANAACLAGFVLLYILLNRLAGSGSARAGVLGLAVFPTAFFLVAPYAEPVFMAFGCAALVAMLAKRHWLAFGAGLLAALSRPFGVLICLPMAAIALGGSPLLSGPGRWARLFSRLRSGTAEAGGSTRATGLPSGALAALGPVAGLAIWALYAGRVAHDPLAVFHVQSLWRRGFGFFPATVVEGFQAWRKWQSTPYGPYFFSDLAATLFGFGLIAAGIVRSRAKPAGALAVRAPNEQSRLFAWGLAAYGSLSLIAALSSPFPPRPLLSMPRFVLALFPLFGAYGSVHSKLRPALFLLSAAGLFIATAVYVAARPLY